MGSPATGAGVAATAKAERARRQADRHVNELAELHRRSASVIQRAYGRYIGLKIVRCELRPVWDAELEGLSSRPAATELYGLCGRLLLFCEPSMGEGGARLSALCKRITASLGSGMDTSTNYCALSFQPQHSAAWIRQVKRLCETCLSKLSWLPKGDKSRYSSELNLLIVLTDWNLWKLDVPARAQPVFNKVVAGTLDHLTSRGQLYSRLRSFLFTQHLLKTEKIWATFALTLASRPILAANSSAAIEHFAIELATIPGFLQRLPQQSRTPAAAVWPLVVGHLSSTQPTSLAQVLSQPRNALAIMANCADGIFSETRKELEPAVGHSRKGISVSAQPPPEVVASFVGMCLWLMPLKDADPSAATKGGSKI